MEWFLIAIIVVPVIAAFAASLSNSGQVSKFVALGTITGKPMREIIEAVGPPTSISASGEGRLYQWLNTNQSGYYHYAILADADDKAVCYTHEAVG